MEQSDIKQRALQLLQSFYGYRSFRPGQWEVISAVAAGRDVLVIMPTGGGKSMCYQMPALLLEGCAVVISPLIALMEDQVQALIANGIPAAAIHSGRSEMDNRQAAEAAIRGKIKILYVSPERLLSDIDVWVNRVTICLFAIDEAHCISQWGHDFRPVYTQLAGIRERFADVPVMALTATADRDTRSDILTQLGLHDPMVWLGSFNRPNLSLMVEQGADARRRIGTIERLIRRYPNDTGIVYTLSRAGAEKVFAELLRRGHRVALYHAGMPHADRVKARQAFSNGDVQVVCATIAFGMGIDKSNIRWIVHNNLPGSIENFYQEIGRAGRDGLPAETILFYSLQDLIMRRKFVEESGRVLVATEKLERMKQYAEAGVCRRRVLLSYFGEEMRTDCGNCDVCLNPPTRFDATILAQKAISAVLRTDSKIGQLMLIDILRGSARAELRNKGYDRIKTYGAGRDVPADAWRYYIQQMVQLGILDVSIADGGLLSVTPYGMRVVRGEEKVLLPEYRPTERRTKEKAPELPGVIEPDMALFEYLKGIRRAIAGEESIPAYMIFGDATLLDMSRKRPKTIDQFLEVTGVGKVKARRYGYRFIGAIKSFNG
ncbi:MAG: DNA helicase RecQ [Muribaculaceae bacterium]